MGINGSYGHEDITS